MHEDDRKSEFQGAISPLLKSLSRINMSLRVKRLKCLSSAWERTVANMCTIPE